jgi:hypothetical protein
LWKELDWLRVLLAIAVIIILTIVYFSVSKWEANEWRDFVLNIITNLIPTFLLFVLAYFAFRRIEELRSERDADELANKVAQKFAELVSAQAATLEENESLQLPKFSDLEMKLHREFDVTKKYFDSKSKPQKLVIQFTNRGSNVIHLEKITYSDKSSGLPKAALSKNYRLDKGRDILIPVEPNTSNILPDGKYVVELILDSKWDADKINGWAGNWGYLHLDLAYADEIVNLQYSI